MKHLKTFESLQDFLQIGYYVLIDAESIQNMTDIFVKFISNNIGQIVRLPSDYRNKNRYDYTKIRYYNIPLGLKHFFTNNTFKFYRPIIEYYAKTKKDLELKLASKKYNI
jgi:hypothetical protein